MYSEHYTNMNYRSTLDRMQEELDGSEKEEVETSKRLAKIRGRNCHLRKLIPILKDLLAIDDNKKESVDA